MSEIKKFEDLTPEQQKTVKKAFKKYLLSGLLTGANYGGLLFFSNLVIIMANMAFMKSTPLMFILCVVADIYILKMMGKANRENALVFSTKVKAVLDEK